MLLEVYTKDNCIFCDQAKALLQSRNISYKEYKLNEDFTREFLLETYSEARTFPVIVEEGFYIGGYNELRDRLNKEIQNTKKLLNEGN